MRLRTWAATSTSVARRSSVCARNLSPITCFHLPMAASARARFVYPDAFCQAMRPWSAMCLRWRSRCVGALSAVSLGTASRPRMTRGRLLVEGRSARLAWERESALAVSRAEGMKHEVPYLSSRAKGLLRSFRESAEAGPEAERLAASRARDRIDLTAEILTFDA